MIIVLHNGTRERVAPSFHLELWDATGLLAELDYVWGPSSSAGLEPGMVKRVEAEVVLPPGGDPSLFAVTPLRPTAVSVGTSRPETPAEAEARLKLVLAQTSDSVISHARFGAHLLYLAGLQPVESKDELVAKLLGEVLRRPGNYSGQVDVRSLSQAWRNRLELQNWATREYSAAVGASEVQERALRLLAGMYLGQGRQAEAGEMLNFADRQLAWRNDIIRQLRTMQ